LIAALSLSKIKPQNLHDWGFESAIARFARFFPLISSPENLTMQYSG
jgi:hypothetical protein